MIAPLMIFTVSCKTKIICSQVKSTQIKPLILKDINFQFNRCRARCFDFNSWEELPFNKCASHVVPERFISFKEEEFSKEGVKLAENYPIEFCDGMGGFSNVDMAIEIKPKIKKLNAIKNDYCE